jgi:predicted kinase
VMDLLDHRLPRLAVRFLNAYLEITGDYAGLRVLRFYLVYRALVRAKVSCLRAHQAGMAAHELGEAEREYRGHLHLAERLAAPAHAALLIMHGLSGSGKTTIARGLLEALGAVRLRSDVERKRLHGLAAQARTGAALAAGIYDAESGRRTYARLAALAAGLLEAGYPVIVDAAFLERAQREPFLREAARRGAACVIAHCTAPAATLRRRVAEREARAADASEAGIAVLEHQLAGDGRLAPDEAALALTLDTETEAGARAGVEAVAARLAAEGEAIGLH